MCLFRLSVPVVADERLDPRHSFEVEAALQAAYRFLKRGAFREALAQITPVRLCAMSRWQSLRILYVEALAARQAGGLTLSATLFDRALHLALDLDAGDDLILLASETAKALYFCTDFLHAAEAASLGLEIDRRLSCPRYLDHRVLDTELRHRLGVCLTFRGDLANAHLYLFTAYHLAKSLPALPAYSAKQAKICWDIALWHHLSYLLPQARAFAEQAIPLLDAFDTPHATARLSVLLAGMILEQAAPHGTPHPLTGRRHLLLKARSLLMDARVRFAASDDRGGEALAALTDVRLARLLGRQEGLKSRIESVLRLAEVTHDLILLGKSYSALGIEMRAIGEYESAKNCLRLAIDAFDVSPAPTEGLFARRALRATEEWHDDLRATEEWPID
jgi:hypothetical protein